MLPETPYVLYMQLSNIRVIHRNGAIKHIYTNQIHGVDHQQIARPFCRPCACSSSSGCTLLQIFLYEDLSTLVLHTSVMVEFPPECQQDRTLLRNQYY